MSSKFYQKYRLKWPWTPTQVTNVDQMFQEIYTAILTINSTLSEAITTGLANSASKTLTYLTVTDESSDLSNSRQLFAGTDLAFDDSVPNQRTVNSTVLPIDLTTDVTGDLPYSNLAQGSALSVLGVTGNATADNASITAASDGQVLRRSGASVGFGAVNLASTNAITGTLPDGNLSTNVPLKNGSNAFTNSNSFANNAIDLLVGQIKFPASQNPSADANTLDDYEEGTWTPTFGGAGGQSGQVYSVQVGTYVKVGQIVNASCAVTLSTLGTITGQVQIAGLPFTSDGTTGYRANMVINWTNFNTAFVTVQGTLSESATAALLVGATAATTSITGGGLLQADLTNTSRAVFVLTYKAAA